MLQVARVQANWGLGFAAAVGWSRWAPPAVHAGTAGRPVRLRQMTLPNEDSDPQAGACYGILRPEPQEGLVRFGEGRPGSQVPTACLEWVCERLKADGKEARLLRWDKASWPRRQPVHAWLCQHHRPAKRPGAGRILVCRLPIKSPWLNRLEPPWVHAKRAVVAPDRLLTKAELRERICPAFNCQYGPPLPQLIAQNVA